MHTLGGHRTKQIVMWFTIARSLAMANCAIGQNFAPAPSPSTEWEYSLPLQIDGLTRVAELSDYDGDHVRDIVIGCQAGGGIRSGIEERYGVIKCVSGKSARVLWNNEGPRFENYSYARSIEGIGDVDGDGIADVAAGLVFIPNPPLADRAIWHRSSVRILSGASGRQIREHLGSEKLVDGFGTSMVSLNDIDGDGVNEYAIGSAATNLRVGDIERGGGIVELYSGKDGSSLGLFNIAPEQPNPQGFGRSIFSAGDLDDDGACDIAIKGGTDDCFGGVLYVFSGRTHKLLWKSRSDLGKVGNQVVFPGDSNADGEPDVAVLVADDSDSPISGQIFIKVLSGMDGALLSKFALNDETLHKAKYSRLGDGSWKLILSPNGVNKKLADLFVAQDQNGCAWVVDLSGRTLVVNPGSRRLDVPALSLATGARNVDEMSDRILVPYRSSKGLWSVRLLEVLPR